MHFLKLRTLSKQSHSDMILQKSRNPLKKEIETPSNFVALLQSNIEQQVASADVLFDNVRTGWLVWSQSVTGYAPPSQSESPIKWEAESSEALEVMTEVLSSQTWWDALAKHLAQELSRPLPSMEHMMFIKVSEAYEKTLSGRIHKYYSQAIFQVFEDRFLPFIQPTIEAMAVDSDRHRMRAGLEMFAGVYRGSKHWPVQKWEHLCQWLDTLIPKITAALRPDTEMCADAAVSVLLCWRFCQLRCHTVRLLFGYT